MSSSSSWKMARQFSTCSGRCCPTLCRDFASAAENFRGRHPRRRGQLDRTQSSLDVALSNKFGADSIRQPPLRSLFKAILAGEVSNLPVQRVQKNGKVLTTFSISTGGMWRLPLPAGMFKIDPEDNRDPYLQHHKVTIHDERLGRLAIRELKKGMQVYVEGELEMRIFNDPDTGAVKRDREVAVHASVTSIIYNRQHKKTILITSLLRVWPMSRASIYNNRERCSSYRYDHVMLQLSVPQSKAFSLSWLVNAPETWL